MSTENAVSFKLTAAEKKGLTDAIAAIEKILKPYLISLTKEQRRAILKMSDGSVPFVEKVYGYTESDPEFMPAFVSREELEKDITAREDLQHFNRMLRQLVAQIDDTEMLAGSEAFSMSLGYYQSVKQAVKMNVPGAKTIYEDLMKRFDRAPASVEETTEEEESTPD